MSIFGNSATSNGASSREFLPNKEHLYGEFLNSMRWRQKTARRATNKALDLPEDDVNTNVSNRTGLDWKGLAILGATVLGAFGLYQFRPQAEPQAPPPPLAQQAPAPVVDEEWELRLFDSEGNVIHLPQRGAE